MTKEIEDKLVKLAEELSCSNDREELIISAIIFTVLGSIKFGSLNSLQDVIIKFAKEQVKQINRIELINQINQN